MCWQCIEFSVNLLRSLFICFMVKPIDIPKIFRSPKNYKISLVCKTNITLLKVVIPIMLFLSYHLIIIMKIANFRLIFHNCLCVCFLNCSRDHMNMLVSFDKGHLIKMHKALKKHIDIILRFCRY